MQLIVESGATKTDVCLTGNGNPVCFRTSGLNLSTMDTDTVSLVVKEVLSQLEKTPGFHADKVSSVYFYCAGLLDGGKAAGEVFSRFFPSAEFEAASDLLAAARALLGDRPGIAAILGTGSNSCLYDGRTVVKNVRPCGYILGDFGSGAALGRIFLADYLQGLMPKVLAEDFHRSSGVDYASAVSAVYGGPAPARYLASFAPYIVSAACGTATGTGGAPCLDSSSRKYALRILEENFRTFFRRCLEQYGTDCGTVGVTGSFGCACREILSSVAREEGFSVAKYLPSPMEGLVEYHA